SAPELAPPGHGARTNQPANPYPRTPRAERGHFRRDHSRNPRMALSWFSRRGQRKSRPSQHRPLRPRPYRPYVEPLEAREMLDTTGARFVNQIYQDLLGRAADQAGLAFWGNF